MQRGSIKLLLIASLIMFALPYAQADALDDSIVQEMKRRHIPGLSVLVLHEGKVVKEKGYGLANVEHNVPVTHETKFQSGSVGKTFTAALVLLLAEDGKLNLNDPISRHLSNTPPAWANKTIRHLLTHTSGLGDPYRQLDMRKDYSDEELIALESGIPMLFAPGERYSYSNMGYHLLGFICNKVGSKFYGDQLRDRIFAPLEMGTKIVSESDIVPHRAAGYEWQDGALRNQAWVSPKLNTTADGSLYLTARDLAKWDQALYGDKILNAKIRNASWTPATLNNGNATEYGFGWRVTKQNNHPLIAHSGAWQGFQSQLSRYVDDKLTVIVLANLASANPTKFAEMIAGYYVPALAIPREQAIADADPAVTAKVKAMLSSLIAGERPVGMNKAMENRFSPETMKRFGTRLKGFGKLNSVELLSRTTIAEKTKFRYRFTFVEETLIVEYQLDSDGLAAGLGMLPE